MTKFLPSEHKYLKITFSISVISLLFILSFSLSAKISDYALDGLLLAINVIVPTAFPFMILTEACASLINLESSKFLTKIFKKLFKINKNGLNALVFGIMGGFPIGAKNAIYLYENGKISKSECERLACFSNVPSSAYVISAVGVGMFGDIKYGIRLYATTLFTSLIFGIILGSKSKESSYIEDISKQRFDFVGSIKTSSIASLYIVFFISFFSVLCGLIFTYVKNKYLTISLISILEVGNASSYISDLYTIPLRLRLAFISFSLSFSGLSVIMQSMSFSSAKINISAKKYTALKFLQGVLAFFLSLLIPC